MGFLPPQMKLAMIFAKMAQQHGGKILHSNNPDLLTKDLSNAMRQQKAILSDPAKGAIMTSYDVLPVILEVKILSVAVAHKLDIDTKGKSTIAVLEEIVQKSEERNGGKYAAGIKETLDWTRKLFSHPEIQDVLAMEMTEIERPQSLKGVFKFFGQLTGRSQDELVRLNEFLKRAKELQDTPDQKPQAAQKPDDKKPEPPKPAA